ncbi:MAG: DnaA/Hda family protein [Planctomycetota bacterium]|nr:DnaA/Hda family protein [Planctomycetota bacterium]
MDIFVIPLNESPPAENIPVVAPSQTRLGRTQNDGTQNAAAQNVAGTSLPWDSMHFLAGPENASICTLANYFLPKLLEQQQAVDHWNPLVLYGPTGSGKSHLVQGLIARWLENASPESCCLINAVDFARELACAIEINQINAFRAKFSRYRCFILEDLQHLQRKESTQQELQLLLDRMVRQGCQCVVTANRSLPQLPWLSFTLSSRLMGGTSISVRRVSRSTRSLLLRDLLAARGLHGSEQDLEKIANHAGNTLPNLRGAVAELELLAKHLETSELAQLLSAWMNKRSTRVPTNDEILRSHAEHFHLTVTQLRSASRTRTVVLARSLAMLLCRELTGASYTKIGEAFGGRDHSTVLHACRKMQQLTALDSAERAAYKQLRGKILSLSQEKPRAPTKRKRRSA